MGGYFKLQTYIKRVQRLDGQFQRDVDSTYTCTMVNSLDTNTGLYIKKSRKDIAVFWNQKDGSGILDDAGNYLDSRKERERAGKLENLFFQKDNKGKYKYVRHKKTRSYELREHWVYKNREARKTFFEEAERRGLTRITEPREEKEIYDFVGGFYYKIPQCNDKQLKAERHDYFTKQQIEAIKVWQTSTLGGAEVEL